MRRNITIGVDPDEYIHLQGAAALCGMPVATYLKWLLRGGAGHDRIAKNEMVQNVALLIKRMDGMASAFERLARTVHTSASSSRRASEREAHDIGHFDDDEPHDPQHFAHVPKFASREEIEKRLKSRGIPSSTIRQLFVVLEELEIIRRSATHAGHV